MTATPSNPQSAGDARNPLEAGQAPIVLTFEDRLQLLWKRHRVLIIVLCAGIALTIVGVGIFEYLQSKRNLDLQNQYAAADTSEKLKGFADAQPEHPLGAAAYLRLADDAFAAGKPADALGNYEKALKGFKDGPLAARTKLGIAVTKLLAGKATEGTAELKQLVDDPNQYKGIRAEAAYHLASLAAEGSNSADVIKYSDLLMQIDPASPWTQRGFALRANFPSPEAPVPSPPVAETPSGATAPTIQIGPIGK